MGLVNVITQGDYVPSDEAAERENAARITDLAFWLRKRFTHMSDEAAFALANALVDIGARDREVSRTEIEATLRKQHYSQNLISEIISTVFVR